MSDRVPGQPEANVPFAPKPKARPEGNFVAEDSGHAIIALLKKAADMAKEDCARVMDVAHKLSFQIRAAEERAREAEAEAAHFRDRATRAETWMLRIRDEVEQTFFQRKEGEGSSPRNSDAPPVVRDADQIPGNGSPGRRG
jgi:hypothetical protein